MRSAMKSRMLTARLRIMDLCYQTGQIVGRGLDDVASSSALSLAGPYSQDHNCSLRLSVS